MASTTGLFYATYDGIVTRSGSEPITDMRDAGSGTTLDATSTGLMTEVNCSGGIATKITRPIMNFNTETIPDAAILGECSFSIWVTAVTTAGGVADEPNPRLYGLSPALTNSLALSQYGAASSDGTYINMLNVWTLTVNTYNTISFTAVGNIAPLINKTGRSTFAIRMKGEVTWSQYGPFFTGDNSIKFRASEAAGDPRLIVNYIIPDYPYRHIQGTTAFSFIVDSANATSSYRCSPGNTVQAFEIVDTTHANASSFRCCADGTNVMSFAHTAT